jgi:polyribonucleotide nucleotidyltransferase
VPIRIIAVRPGANGDLRPQTPLKKESNMIVRESVMVGDTPISVEIGRVAKQAHGAVLIQEGESVALVTAVSDTSVRKGIDFFPLTCDYVEKTYAAGKIPGGFFKREARQRDYEILTSRIIDRPIRPLFPSGFKCETQVIATIMSMDKIHPADMISVTGASVALTISNIPFDGPIAAVRVGRINGKLIVNPTFQEQDESDINLIVVGRRDAIVMVEGGAKFVPEAEIVDALIFGHHAMQPLLDLQVRLREALGKPKRIFEPPQVDEALRARVRELATSSLEEATLIKTKMDRYGRIREIKESVLESLSTDFMGREGEIKAQLDELKRDIIRRRILDEDKRIDGRTLREVRQITCEVGVLPRTHGSALFTRGETQALVTATLGTRQDEQKIDALIGESWKDFMLHYNFPPFSVGECKFLRGPGRREIGHGALAERALTPAIPTHEDAFPYTIRVVSEILESNGSSSMASVCGGSLALMDAGVPSRAAVAGIAMGLISDGNRFKVLSDILGDEDHTGDMDFKVTGGREGITALQMDIKVDGLPEEVLRNALDQAREGRLHILDRMDSVLPQARAELSPHAPRIVSVKVRPDQIRIIIGPGGKTIRGIVDQTGASVDVEDDGTVNVASADAAAVAKALEIIAGLTTEPVAGEEYEGTVKRVVDFGAFVEILPGIEGLLHISEMDWEHVGSASDVCTEGETIKVKCLSIENDGKMRLSRKVLLPKPEGYVERPPRERSSGGGYGGGGGGGGRDRGPRRDDRGRGGPPRSGGGGGGGERRTRRPGGGRNES